MIATGRRSAHPPPSGGDPAPERPARIRRRRPLPGGRALVGGLLVSASAVGMFALYLHAVSTSGTPFVVATRDLAVGQRLTLGDLSTSPMRLPASIADRQVFRDPRSLVGAVVVGPVQAGGLLEVSDVVSGASAAPGRQLSFPIDASRAVDGTLEIGDSVDVIATYGSGLAAVTTTVAQGLRVVGHEGQAASFGSGSSSSEVVTLSVPASVDLLKLVEAINVGQVVLVRSSGTPSPSGGEQYVTPPGSQTSQGG